jgi:hypothetical protein
MISSDHRADTPLEALDFQTAPSDAHNQQLQTLLANAEARVTAAENQASALNARYNQPLAVVCAVCVTLRVQL